MADETKVSWLKRAYKAEKLVGAYLEKMEHDRELARKLTRTFSETRSSTNNNSTEDALIRFAESSQKAQEKLDELIRIRTEISDAINKIDDYDLQAILIMRYLNYFTFDRIAETMCYEPRTVYRKHSQAIEKLVSICH